MSSSDEYFSDEEEREWPKLLHNLPPKDLQPVARNSTATVDDTPKLQLRSTPLKNDFLDAPLNTVTLETMNKIQDLEEEEEVDYEKMSRKEMIARMKSINENKRIQRRLDKAENTFKRYVSSIQSLPPEERARRFEAINQTLLGKAVTLHNERKKASEAFTVNQVIDDLNKQSPGLLVELAKRKRKIEGKPMTKLKGQEAFREYYNDGYKIVSYTCKALRLDIAAKITKHIFNYSNRYNPSPTYYMANKVNDIVIQIPSPFGGTLSFLVWVAFIGAQYFVFFDDEHLSGQYVNAQHAVYNDPSNFTSVEERLLHTHLKLGFIPGEILHTAGISIKFFNYYQTAANPVYSWFIQQMLLPNSDTNNAMYDLLGTVDYKFIRENEGELPTLCHKDLGLGGGLGPRITEPFGESKVSVSAHCDRLEINFPKIPTTYEELKTSMPKALDTAFQNVVMHPLIKESAIMREIKTLLDVSAKDILFSTVGLIMVIEDIENELVRETNKQAACREQLGMASYIHCNIDPDTIYDYKVTRLDRGIATIRILNKGLTFVAKWFIDFGIGSIFNIGTISVKVLFATGAEATKTVAKIGMAAADSLADHSGFYNMMNGIKRLANKFSKRSLPSNAPKTSVDINNNILLEDTTTMVASTGALSSLPKYLDSVLNYMPAFNWQVAQGTKKYNSNLCWWENL